MQLVGVLLGLLGILLIVAPVGAVVVMYQNNLTELVIPPEVDNLLNGNVSSFLVSGGGSGGGESFLGDNPLTSLIVPEFVGADIDTDTNTFTLTLDITNNVNTNFVLDTFGTDIRSASDDYHLVTVALPEPVTLVSGQTSRVIVIGTWTDAAEEYMLEHYAGASSASVELVNTSIGVNGVTVTLSEPINVDIPLSLEA
jgi:hypothetical protein